MNIWFWSDTHVNHDNIITLSKRPFDNVTEMNEVMLELYNSRVKPGDIVYHLGDVIYPPKSMHHISYDELGARMPGNNILIRGNHDMERLKGHDGIKIFEHWMWSEYHDYLEIKFGKSRFVLCHYPIEHWRNSHRGWFHLHGHLHGSGVRVIPHRLDVGVDALPDFGPIHIEQLRDHLENQSDYVPEDHHGLPTPVKLVL